MCYMFSQNLRTIRKERKMSQKALAKRLHVNIHAVYRWENNISYPTIDLVYDIARILEVNISKLLTE